MLLHGGRPLFAARAWIKINQGPVWWDVDTDSHVSLGDVFGKISQAAWYYDAISNREEPLSITRVRTFRISLMPNFATLSAYSPDPRSRDEMGVTRAYTKTSTLTRSFQHAALIYLYRAICGFEIDHPLVQQHISPCLDCIFAIERSSQLFNCVLFPLLIAGAHLRSRQRQREVTSLIQALHDRMKFTSIKMASKTLTFIWDTELQDVAWHDMYAQLRPGVAIL